MSAGAREVVRLILAGDASGFEGAVGKAEGAGGRMRAVGATIAAAGAAMAATGFSVGAAWEKSRDQIIATTGATGDALAALQADVRGLAQDGFGLEPATRVIAEVNRHLGLTGDTAQSLGKALLQSGADAGKFSTASEQLGLDAAGAEKFLDQLAVASQRSGVSIDDLSDEIIDRAGDWDEGGASMDHLASTVVQAALEFGKGGLETSLGLASEMVTKGMIPAVQSLDQSLGDTTGAVQSAAAESRTWRDEIRKTKDALIATVAPYGDVVGAVGSMGAALGGFMTVAPQVATASRAMWAALGGPATWAIAAITAVGAAAWYFRDEIKGAFMAVLDYVRPWVETFLGYVETAVGWIPGVGDNLSAMVGAAREKLGEFGDVAAEAGETAGEGIAVAVRERVMAPETGVPGSLVASIKAAEESPDVAKAAEDAAAKVMEAFWDRAEAETEARVQASALGLRSTTVQAAIAAAGSDAGLAFDLGFMDGPGGVMTTIPQSMMKLAGDGSWTLSGAKSGGGFLDGLKSLGGGGGGEGGGLFGSLKSMFGLGGGTAGGSFVDKLGGALGGGGIGGGISGMFSSGFADIGGIVSAFTSGDWKSGIDSLITTGLNFLPPGMSQIAQVGYAAFKKAWDWFRKPSETELAARSMWTDVETQVIDTLQGNADYSAEVDRAMADGWDRSTAEMRAAFVHLGQQAGLTYDESFDAYAQYEKAVREGDVDTMRQLEGSLADWLAADKATADAMAAPDGGPARTAEAIKAALTQEETGALSVAAAALGALPGQAETMAGGVNTALGRIQREIAVNIRRHTTYSSSGSSDEGGGEGEGMQHGTGGLFRQFGAGRRAVLHGMEAVVPRFAVPTLAGDLAAALASIIPVGATAGGPPVVIADVRIGNSELDRITDESMRRQERILDYRGRA